MFTLFSFFLSFSFHYYSSFLTFSVFFLILVVFTSFIFRMFVSFTFRTISILSIFHFIFLLNILVLFSLCARLNWQCVCQFLSANFPLYCIRKCSAKQSGWARVAKTRYAYTHLHIIDALQLSCIGLWHDTCMCRSSVCLSVRNGCI